MPVGKAPQQAVCILLSHFKANTACKHQNLLSDALWHNAAEIDLHIMWLLDITGGSASVAKGEQNVTLALPEQNQGPVLGM